MIATIGVSIPRHLLIAYTCHLRQVPHDLRRLKPLRRSRPRPKPPFLHHMLLAFMSTSSRLSRSVASNVWLASNGPFVNSLRAGNAVATIPRPEMFPGAVLKSHT
jgi:hypothetical protein